MSPKNYLQLSVSKLLAQMEMEPTNVFLGNKKISLKPSLSLEKQFSFELQLDFAS